MAEWLRLYREEALNRQNSALNYVIEGYVQSVDPGMKGVLE